MSNLTNLKQFYFYLKLSHKNTQKQKGTKLPNPFLWKRTFNIYDNRISTLFSCPFKIKENSFCILFLHASLGIPTVRLLICIRFLILFSHSQIKRLEKIFKGFSSEKCPLKSRTVRKSKKNPLKTRHYYFSNILAPYKIPEWDRTRFIFLQWNL